MKQFMQYRFRSVETAMVGFLAMVCGLLSLTGCSQKSSLGPNDNYGSMFGGAPRLVIRGNVTDEHHMPLRDIRIAVYSLHESSELEDIPGYNCAFTDSTGAYTIIRYRGRELPEDVILTATDTTGYYTSDTIVAPVVYQPDPSSPDQITPYNGFVTADFTLFH